MQKVLQIWLRLDCVEKEGAPKAGRGAVLGRRGDVVATRDSRLMICGSLHLRKTMKKTNAKQRPIELEAPTERTVEIIQAINLKSSPGRRIF